MCRVKTGIQAKFYWRIFIGSHSLKSGRRPSINRGHLHTTLFMEPPSVAPPPNVVEAASQACVDLAACCPPAGRWRATTAWLSRCSVQASACRGAAACLPRRSRSQLWLRQTREADGTMDLRQERVRSRTSTRFLWTPTHSLPEVRKRQYIVYRIGWKRNGNIPNRTEPLFIFDSIEFVFFYPILSFSLSCFRCFVFQI